MNKIEKFLNEFPTLDYEGTEIEDKGRYFRLSVKSNLVFDVARIKDKVHIRLVSGFYEWQNGLKIRLNYDIYTITWFYFLTAWGNTYHEEIPNGAFVTRKFLRWHDEEDFQENAFQFLFMSLSDIGLVSYYDYNPDEALYEDFWFAYGKTLDDFKIN